MEREKCIISVFLLFYSVFFEVRGFDLTLIGQTKNFALLLFVLYNWKMFYMLKHPKYKGVNILLIIFCAVILYSSWINQKSVSDITLGSHNEKFRNMNSVRFDHQIYYVLKIISVTLFVEFINVRGKIKPFLETLFCLFALWGIFVNIDGCINYHKDGDGYLLGNKFDVTYYNIYLIVLFAILYPLRRVKNKTICTGLILYSVLLCIHLKCMTSLIAYFSLYFLLNSSDASKRKLSQAKISLLSLLFADTIFIFFNTFLLDNSISEFLLVDVLGKDLTLTSRTDIYMNIGEVIALSPMFGFGIDNFYSVCSVIIGAPNAQNGLANLIVEIGVVGLVAFIFLQFFMISKKTSSLWSFPIMAYIYVMIIVSSVEIPFSLSYFCFSPLILLDSLNIKNTVKI